MELNLTVVGKMLPSFWRGIIVRSVCWQPSATSYDDGQTSGDPLPSPTMTSAWLLKLSLQRQNGLPRRQKES